MDRILNSEIRDYAEMCYRQPHSAPERTIQNQMKSFVLNYGRKKHKGIYDRDLAIRGLANNLVPNLLKGYFRGQPPRTSALEKMLMATEILPMMRNDIVKAQKWLDAGYYNVGGKWVKKKG